MHIPDGSSFVCVIDIESTNLDPTTGALLEFGAVLCRDDLDLTPIAEASLLFRPPGQQIDHDRLWAGMHPAVRDMHTANGLWQEATHDPDAWTPAEADPHLLAWLDRTTTPDPGGQPRPVAFAGSGVGHMEDRWLPLYLPHLRARLTYWHLDAGVIRRALQYARRDDLVDLHADVHGKPHRALDDARLHAAELRRYLALFQRIPAATPVADGTA